MEPSDHGGTEGGDESYQYLYCSLQVKVDVSYCSALLLSGFDHLKQRVEKRVFSGNGYTLKFNGLL